VTTGAEQSVMWKPSEWLYYLRFMVCGVRLLWPGGVWTLLAAIEAIHNEYVAMMEWARDERDTPEGDVRECLSCWSD
jgi:hypothetical protein